MSVNKVNSDGSLSRVAGGILYADAPIGEIHAFGGSVVPSGYLLCNGQAVSRTEYSELFAVIGTAYGKGDNSTTFNVPDLREAVPKGTGLNAKGAYHYDNDGIALGEFVDDRIKSHAHNVYVRDTGHYHGTDSGSSLPSPNNLNITKNSNGVGWGANPVAGTASNTQPVSANIQVSSKINFGEIDNATTGYGYATNEVKAVGANYIIKAKHAPVPADFSDSLIGYLGKETNYNLYPWSHTRTQDGADDSQDITIDSDGWYSIDYTLTNSTDTNHTFTLRDFDSQGDVHTIKRTHYDKSGTFRESFLVPLKAGTYRYSHGGVGTLNVYMNRRDFA